MDDEGDDIMVPYLGLVGEIGSVITEIKKKIRDGLKYRDFKQNLSEELGDVLWYLTTIATRNGLSLEEIGKKNIKKINDRWSKKNLFKGALYDDNFPEQERLPREFEVEFFETNDGGKKIVKFKVDGKEYGDPLTDNTYDDSGYRYHDIFHFGYVAFLGWSPVLRKLLGKKRKSVKKIDEVEDGGRAYAIEEGLSAFIYSKSLESKNFEGITTIDYDFLRILRKFVNGLEVSNRSLLEWQTAILQSYEIFRRLKKEKGGRVLVSLKNRKLIFIGK